MDIDNFLDFVRDVDEYTAAFRANVSDLTWQEFRMLDLAAKEPNYNLVDFGNERFIYAQGVGRMAAGLAFKGYVDIVKSDRDSRSKNLVITRAGKNMLDHARQTLAAILA